MSPRSLEGRVALVTGAGSGLGRAITQHFSAEGARVVAADINLTAAQKTAEDINALRRAERGDVAPMVEAVPLDVADPVQVDDVVRVVSNAHGDAFDLVVSNAGIDRGAEVPKIDDDEWRQVFATNVDGAMYLSRAFVRHRLHLGMTPHVPGYAASSQVAAESPQRCADLVYIASISALTVGAGAAAYNASKAALLKLGEVMQTEARELKWPVRVSVIHPAAMATPTVDQWDPPEDRVMDPLIVAQVVNTAITLPPEANLQSAVVALRNANH